MAYSLEQELGGKGSEAYARYQEGKSKGKWKDYEDFLGQGGSSSSGKVTSTDDYVKQLFEANKKAIEEETKWIKEYSKKNPFVFDELLAKKSATAEYEPYYTELLQDYISDVETKRQTVQDDQALSKTLAQYNTERSSREYARAEEQAMEGFAGSGMFFSGIKERTLGELGIEKESTLGEIGETRNPGHTNS
jgi:hypothetical protein